MSHDSCARMVGKHVFVLQFEMQPYSDKGTCISCVQNTQVVTW